MDCVVVVEGVHEPYLQQAWLSLLKVMLVSACSTVISCLYQDSVMVDSLCFPICDAI